MVCYLSDSARLSGITLPRSYPNLRYDFLPRAYVVLTREIETDRMECHG